MTVKWHFQVPKRMVHIHKIKILPFQLQVKRKIKTFTTQTKTIKASQRLKYNTEITLNFDSEDIEDYVEKKEKENSLKNKLIEFFAGYSLANNAAFNQSDFDFVSSYIKKG